MSEGDNKFFIDIASFKIVSKTKKISSFTHHDDSPFQLLFSHALIQAKENKPKEKSLIKIEIEMFI